MTSKESKRKINFIKDYWIRVLNVDVYTYEEFKLNNLNTYFDELIEIITLIEREQVITKTKNGLLFFLREIISYIESNYFFKTAFSKEFNDFKNRIKKIISANEKSNVKKDLVSLRKLMKQFRDTQTSTIDKMLKELSLLVYSTKALEIDLHWIKSLVNDLISELLNAGYTRKFLKKEVYIENTYDFNTKKMVDFSLREQFQNKIEKFNEKNRLKDVVVIFRINNLKTMMPYELDGILFYNPIRSDLLEWKYNQKVLFMEEGLLNSEEREILQKRRKNEQKLTESDWSQIKYTDAHCRIRLKNINTNFANKIARRKVEEVVNTIRYIYDLNHISISKEYAIRYGLRSNSPLFKGRDTSKYTRGSYRGFELEDDIKRDKLDDKSFINTILNSGDIQKDWLLKGLRSLYVGEDQDLPLNKFIHYWIALEYLVGLRGGNNIKSSLLNNCSEILTRNYFRRELVHLYNEFRNMFYQKTSHITIGDTPVPEEIMKLPGLSDFMFSCNLYSIADNLHMFEKYSKSEYLIFRIREFSNIFEKLDERENFISKLEKNYKNLLARLYRIRNRIFHSALVDEIELELYCEWLHSIVIALCNDLIYRLESNSKVVEYREWKKIATKERYSVINYS